MIELSLQFTSDEKEADSPLFVSLFRPDSGVREGPLPYSLPLDDDVLADIHWYLETFSVWPTGPDYLRAEEIERQLEGWGRALRDSIRLNADAADIWRQFMDAEGEKLLTIDATDPRLLRLPWELLADESGHLFSAGISVRRRLQKTTSKKQAPLPLPVRILVVVARPDDAGFIDPRAITRPLLDAVAGLGEAVVVEFLPEPTLKALSARLRDRSAPPVHVVHFDGHGVYDQSLGLGFLLFENEKQESDQVDANRLGNLLNQSGTPLMVLNACQSGMQKESNPYASVAARLIRAGVGSVLAMNYSVLVVAAHKFVAAFYAGLAAGLTVGQAVDKGRLALLADIDRHTITRPNAAGEMVEETIHLYDWFLPALYQQSSDPVIFRLTSPDAAADAPSTPVVIPVRQTYPGLVRLVQTLFNKEDLRQLCYTLGVQYDDLPGDGNAAKALSLVELAERQSAVDALVDAARSMRPLADWQSALTPAAAAEALTLRQAQDTAAQSPSTAASPAALPPPPRYRFHGRSREMLLLDRAFRQSPLVVLHGFGGLGKTALAAEAGRWFTRTGRFPGGAAFISFEHGGSLAQLCSWVGQTVSGDPDWLIHGEGDPVMRVGQLLAQKPALLILDNFESVLGRNPEMPQEELQGVLAAVYQWAVDSGQTSVNSGQWTVNSGARVLITTRDTRFNDERFASSALCRHIPLQGLAEPEALALAAVVLNAKFIDRAAIPRQDLVELMRHLGGHPLSLNLVLPHLRRYTPRQLMDSFEALLPGFVDGKAEERNESLAVSLDFSLRRLGEETRAALPDLAVFAGGCMEYDLLAVTGMDETLWQAARGELEQAALVTAEAVPGMNVSFLRFHPTLTPYLATQLADERRAALEDKYWREYYATARELYQLDTQHPHEARAIALREMPNLRRALELALAAAADDPALLETAVTFADRIALFLDVFGRWRERDGMMKQVSDQFTVNSGQSGPGGKSSIENQQSSITKAEYLLLSRQGETLLQQGQAAGAEALFRGLLARLEAGAAYDAAYDIAMTQMRLGRCLAAQGRPGQAIAFHEQAAAGFAALGEDNKSAKKMLSAVSVNLADNLALVGEFDKAQQAYETGLAIAKEVDDDRTVGVALGQLGMLALQRGDRTAARARYREALQTFQRLGEPQSEAVVWHQLGRVAEESREWAEAERCYRESLQIEEAHGNLPGVAQTCNQLAMVAEENGRFPDAERWYLRAQEIKNKVAPKDASTLNNLANLYLSQNRLAEAAQFARRALDIMETLDLSAEPWKTYQILAKIAAAQGDAAAAREWRRKANESRDAFAGTQHQIGPILQQFQSVIAGVVAANNGDEEAKAQIEGLFDTFRKGNWQIVDAIQQIWTGERDAETLTDDIDYNSRAIVLAILQHLTGAAPPAAQIGSVSISTAPPVPAELRQAWGPVVVAVAAAAQGNTQAAAQVEPVLQELAGRPDWQALASVLRRILAGERDTALLAGLDETDTLIAGNVLRGLGVAGLEGLPGLEKEREIEQEGEPEPEREGDEGERANAFLNSLLAGVVMVARGEGPPELGVQIHAVTRGLATDTNAGPELQALGRALNAILSGDRDPDLSDLPPPLAAAVQQVLAQVAAGG